MLGMAILRTKTRKECRSKLEYLKPFTSASSTDRCFSQGQYWFFANSGSFGTVDDSTNLVNDLTTARVSAMIPPPKALCEKTFCSNLELGRQDKKGVQVG